MDIRALQSFIMLANTLNFTRAAELMYISQPSLSKQIVNLEDELGVPLFKRNKRGVELTVYGKVFLNDAKEIINQWEKSINHIEQVKYGDNGFVRIGFIRDFPIKIVPESIKLFTKENPEVNIKLKEFGENECIEVLCKGDVDAVFTFWEGIKNSEDFDYLIIKKIQYV
ncbi:LysR family transcriptional regulator [Caloramator quimbayensis]|nr:LysR family transcriptional regulator [Caloramator quimbayensis]